MKNNLKVGDSFEVVEVLEYDGYKDKNLYKKNGLTLAVKDEDESLDGLNVLENGSESEGDFNYFWSWEYRKLGKLTITKLK